MIGQRIRAHRTRLNITQEQLAERMGVHVNTVRSLESNGDAKISTLKAVAYALGTTPADLFAPEDGDPHVSAGEVLGAAAKLRTDTEEALADGVIDAAERERLRSDSDAVTEAAERYSQSITLGHR